MAIAQLAGGKIGGGEFEYRQGWKFESADLSINANTTWSTGSSYVDVESAGLAHVVVKATGANASSAGTVTFNFKAVGDSATMTAPTSVSFSKALTLNANNAVAVDFLVDCSAYGNLKLSSVVNGDAAYGLTGVNAEIYWKVKRAF